MPTVPSSSRFFPQGTLSGVAADLRCLISFFKVGSKAHRLSRVVTAMLMYLPWTDIFFVCRMPQLLFRVERPCRMSLLKATTLERTGLGHFSASLMAPRFSQQVASRICVFLQLVHKYKQRLLNYRSFKVCSACHTVGSLSLTRNLTLDSASCCSVLKVLWTEAKLIIA